MCTDDSQVIPQKRWFHHPATELPPAFANRVVAPLRLACVPCPAAATNAATVVFNFLVVGVTAKVTKVVAVGAWGQVGSRIRLALGMALVMGLAACGLLLALQRPLWQLLDSSSPLVLSVAEAYFYLRVAGVPPQLLVMCTSGILQGYKVRVQAQDPPTSQKVDLFSCKSQLHPPCHAHPGGSPVLERRNAEPRTLRIFHACCTGKR